MIAPPPATVTNDTREWRRKSDLILRWFDDTLVAEITEAKADRGCGYCIPGKDMYEAFAQWLDAEGHRKWSAQTFVDRFGQHDEIVSQRIVHDRVRLSTTKLRVDRKPSPFSLYNPPNPLPERFRAWLHVRFRTEDDDRAEGSEQGKQDIGTYGTDGLGERPIKPLTRDKPEQASRTSQDGAADDSATKFKPPTGSGRCLQCGWHSSTQGHAPSCPSKEEARR